MDKCPECNAELSLQDKQSGKCHACLYVFDISGAAGTDGSHEEEDDRNTVGVALKGFAMLYLVIGSIVAVTLAVFRSSIFTFFVVLISCITTSFFFLGISEIICMLYDIRKRN